MKHVFAVTFSIILKKKRESQKTRVCVWQRLLFHDEKLKLSRGLKLPIRFKNVSL